MKIGVMTSNLQLGLEPGIRTAAEMGAQGVQIWVTGSELGPEQDAGTIDRTVELVKSLGMEISATCGDIGGFGAAEGLEDRIARTKAMLELTARMGVRVMTTHIGVVPEDKSHPQWRRIHDSLKELAPTCERLDVYFATETGPEHPVVLRELLDAVGSRYISVNFDPANFVMYGYDAVGAVTVLRDYIVHTHAKDGRRIGVHQIEEYPLGQGDVWWPRYIQRLQDVGYDGFLTVEREGGSNRVGEVRQAVAFLQQLLSGR